MLITNLFFFDDVKNERGAQIYMEWFQPELTKHFTEEFNSETDPNHGSDITPKAVSACICRFMESDEKIIEDIIRRQSKFEKVIQMPKFVKMQDDCVEVIKELVRK